jgi:hypothetical protein
MDDITAIAKLFGKKNEQRLKDTIIDMMIERVQDELNDFDSYLFDYDALFNEIQDETKTAIKKKYMKKYMEKVDKKFEDMFEKCLQD